MPIFKHFSFQTLGFLFFISFFCISSFLFANAFQNKQLKINVISKSNGKGLDTDQKVLKEALERLNCQVTLIDVEETKWHRAHINIFIQDLAPEKLPMAQQNWFIPNPEWCLDYYLPTLEHIHLILCRTKETERIFQQLSTPTYYLGFTSPDCYQKEIKKDYRHLFHLAGGSHLKGTRAIKNIWLSTPTLPFLTVINFLASPVSKHSHLEWISTRVSTENLRKFQNQCGIHLCPSETEGFGHYLNEAMSSGAIVITTNAPPMNEFIQDPRCLVPYVKKKPMNLATCYEVDPKQLQAHIESLIQLSPEELKVIGQRNRSIYLQQRQDFYERLQELILTAMPLIG